MPQSCRNWLPPRATLALAMLAAVALSATTLPCPAQAPFNGQAGVTNGLYGRPTAQPFFDFPNWARFSNCRPGPLPWGYEVFPPYGPCDCACNQVVSVGCPGGFVAHRPSDWYATGDFAPLTIDYPDDIQIARLGPMGFPMLTTSDLEPEFDAGGKFTVGRRIFDCYRLEATYFGDYSWFDAAAVTNADPNTQGGTGNLSSFLSQFADPIVPGLDENERVEIFNFSEMRSYEVNLRYWIDMPPGPFDVSVLVGARRLRIDEQFNFVSVANVPAALGAVNDLQVNTFNDMWGVQVGICGDLLIHPRYWITTDLKGGMFDNDASQVTRYAFTDNAGVQTIFPTDAAAHRTAWMLDLSIVGSWQMTPTLSLRAGYQGVFVTGAAVAFQNVQTDNAILRAGPGLLNDEGQIVYHGPILGLTWMR